jgi:hypothetical protein
MDARFTDDLIQGTRGEVCSPASAGLRPTR